MSQPVMVEQGLFDPDHGFFEQGGARQAAEAAMAVVNNEGWLPSAGDGDLRRQFPGPSLRAAAAYYGDGRYRFVHDLATPDRRLAWLTAPPRAFDSGIEGVVPGDAVGVTVVPVDPVVYHAWDRDPDHAAGVVTSPPDTPIDSCFDKIAVRTGWTAEDDYLLIDGLGGGSHSYDDAGAILEYARFGLSLIVQEDSFVHSAPEHHSAVTVVRDGEAGVIPGFASLEAEEAREDGTVYLRVRLRDYAGADWIREVFLVPGRCVVLADTVTATQAGDYAVEARLRTPARFELDGTVARSIRQSPVAGEVVFRIESLCEPTCLSVSEDPVHLRYQDETNQNLWKARYQTDDVVLSTLVAREAAHLEAGQGVRLVHLAQAMRASESPIAVEESGSGICLIDGEAVTELETVPIPAQAKAPQESGNGSREAGGPTRFADAEGHIRALCPIDDGSLVAGTVEGQVVLWGEDRNLIWRRQLEGPVRDIGAAGVGAPLIAVGHGETGLTAFDMDGNEAWSVEIDRDPCPWPWWELPTPAAVQVVGGVDQGEAFFAVGCGDIQVRCFDARGKERWRQRYNEGVPGRVRVEMVDGSGSPRILAGGEILSDTSTCRILDTGGQIMAHLSVEGWTSILTALETAGCGGRHYIACGANRGKNLHLFASDGGEGQSQDPPAWDRAWMARLGGSVNGIGILPASGRLLAGTSKGFLLCYELAGDRVWHRLLDEGVDHVFAGHDRALVCTAGGALLVVDADGSTGEAGRLPGPCASAGRAGDWIYLASGSSVWVTPT
jgi:hypothetical protein